jgi:hypothetical protein
MLEACADYYVHRVSSFMITYRYGMMGPAATLELKDWSNLI